MLILWNGFQKIYDVVLWLKIFFLRQWFSARNQEVETKVDVVWIIIITIFIIIYYSYVIICSLPSVNEYKKLPYQVQNMTYIVLLEFNTEKVEVLTLR